MPQSLSVIIRSRNESTTNILYKQLQNQLLTNDTLYLLNDPVPFEEKLRQSYEVSINDGRPYSVIIDADILVCPGFISKVKKLIPLLSEQDLGFGLKILDKFYGAPKYRGIHIYNVKLLPLALKYIPVTGQELRPESYVKDKMGLHNHKWANGISNDIYGIHDYFQNFDDIFCKFAIRSHRSASDFCYLNNRFNKYGSMEYKVASKALKYGTTIDNQLIENNRDIFSTVFAQLFPELQTHKRLVPTWVRVVPYLYVSIQILLSKFHSIHLKLIKLFNSNS